MNFASDPKLRVCVLCVCERERAERMRNIAEFIGAAEEGRKDNYYNGLHVVP